MVQDGAVQNPLADPPPVRAEICITRVIGGRLRALYDDSPLPCPTLVNHLLRLLDDTNPVMH